MSERRWDFVVRDARARHRHGTVVWCDSLPSPLKAPTPPAEFAIYVLSSQARVRDAPERTAICRPGAAKIRPLADPRPQHLPASVEALTLPPYRMAAYAGGRIVTAVRGLIEAAEVFAAGSDHPRLDRLALALLDVADADERAPYIALLRREFGVAPGADPLGELGRRLAPEDTRERPPARAPGVLRLARALRRLRAGQRPEQTLDEYRSDLAFLKLFDAAEPWSPEALERLLADVVREPASRRGKKRPARRNRTAKTPANVIPLKRDPSDAPPAEDA
jgi:hypothetical protein